jgi:LacI family transcriptional regulator
MADHLSAAQPEEGEMAAKRASIRDVAALAGVSLTTVSHALNEVEGARVAEETRIRVREAADKLGYTPNRMARGLRMQRAHTLGLISDRIATTPFAVNMILGAQEAALKRGWTLLLLNTGADPEAEQRAIQELLQHQADGVLYASMYHRIVSVPSALRGIPTVLLDAEATNSVIPAVVPDEVGGAHAAVEHLTQHGHRRIGYLSNVDDIPATPARLQGYRTALRAAGIRFDPSLVVTEESDSAGGYRAARKLLQRRAQPTALFCFNDRMAMGAYRAAAERHLVIPDDLSVVGFDNQEVIAEGLHPQLTTVSLPHYEMGSWAVETLIELIASTEHATEATYPFIMACPLIHRLSVGTPPPAP